MTKESVCRGGAAIIAFLTVLGAAWPVLFNEGSAAGKFITRAYEVESAGDVDFEAAMATQLYGEAVEVTTTATQTDPAATIASVSRVRQLDRGVAVLCLFLTVALPLGCRRWAPLAWLYLIPAAWLLINAQATASNGGKAFADLAVPAHATRWGMFVALALLSGRTSKRDQMANWLLRFVCAMTFAIHGWEAFHLNPAFQDLLFASAGHAGIELSESVCHGLLRTIGIMDMVLAASVLAINARPLLMWMCCWGLITAASRPVAMGLDAWPEFAMRLPNGAAPLFLLFLGLPAAIKLWTDAPKTKPEPLTT
jgi:hypothetical protein